MPNTPGRIGAGITGLVRAQPPRTADRAALEEVFGALARSVELPEAQIGRRHRICGSGPAYVFEFAAALREAGWRRAFDADIAGCSAAETLLGAARLLSAGECGLPRR